MEYNKELQQKVVQGHTLMSLAWWWRKVMLKGSDASTGSCLKAALPVDSHDKQNVIKEIVTKIAGKYSITLRVYKVSISQFL